MHLSKKYDHDLMKVKTILEEDIIDKIDTGASPSKETKFPGVAANVN